jgi:predicted dehydrogenase
MVPLGACWETGEDRHRLAIACQGLSAEHGIAAGNAAGGWRQLAERGRPTDAVLICTQDRMHAERAEAFAASHLTVFAAKRARLNGTVEKIPPLT